MNCRRYAIIYLIIITASLFIVLNSSAQDASTEKMVSVDFKNASVSEATSAILKDNDIKFIIDKSFSRPITIKLIDVPLSDAIHGLLNVAGASGRIENGTLHICPMAREAKFAVRETTAYFGNSVTRDDSEKTIRVGLINTVGRRSSFIIASSNGCTITDAATGSIISASEVAQVTLTGCKDGIDITMMGKSAGVFKGPIKLQSSSGRNAFEIVSPKVKNYRYTGILEVSSGPTLKVVNELLLEDYVRGVIPVEIPASFKPEAQKALTLAIRTYALKSTKRHASDGFNLCDSIDCQGFSGALREVEWVDNLIDQTRGQVITSSGELIYSLYSSDCGGATQNNEDAGVNTKPWPYLRSVVDSPGEDGLEYCAGSPCHSWSKLISFADLEKVFGKNKSQKLGTFKSIDFTVFDVSGRVKTVTLKYENGESQITGARFRDLFGLSVIKSTKMTLTPNPDGSILAEGKGYGHGLGICAFGANGMAKTQPGIAYIDILRHYYTGTDIMRLKNDGSMEPVPYESRWKPVITERIKPVQPKPEPIIEPAKPEPAEPLTKPKPVIKEPKQQVPVKKNPPPADPKSGPRVLPGRA